MSHDTQSEAGEEPGQRASLIEAHGLRKSFIVRGRELVVFDDLSLTVEDGAFLSIIGPSGCGKSTLLKVLAGLDLPTGGAVTFRGAPVRGPAKGLIYVFQQYAKSILPWRTVLQNIEFGLSGSGSRAQAREKCMEYVQLVGLDGYENHYPYQLSGGMQQRVVIARALICEPAALLMDEPFSAVDALTRALLQELILKIWSEIKLTVVFVTHDVEEAVFLSSRIVSLTRAPARIHENIAIDLAYPRDQIATREAPTFTQYRHRLFSSIFLQEKGVEAAAADSAGAAHA